MERTLSRLVALALIALSFTARGAVVGVYDFNVVGNAVQFTATPDPAYGTYATLGAFGAGSGTKVTGSTTPGYGGANGYAIAGNYNNSPSTYISFTITPQNVSAFALSTIGFQVRQVETGAKALTTFNAAIYDSANTLVYSSSPQTLPAASTVWSAANFTFTGATLTPDSTYTVRMWALGGSPSSLMYIDDLEVNAGLTPVPEPVNLALVLFSLGGGGFCAIRRFMHRKKIR
jgi:hypothetical protein